MDAGKVADLVERLAKVAHGWVPEPGCEGHGGHATLADCPGAACKASIVLVAELRAEAAKVIDSPKVTLCVVPGCLAQPRAPGFMWCGPHAPWDLTGRSA